jgi:hypothetical protein
VESPCIANWHIFERSDGNDGQLAAHLPPTVLQGDPKLADNERQAGKAHEFREISPRDIPVLWRVDWKVVSPLGLLFHRATIGRNGMQFRIGF